MNTTTLLTARDLMHKDVAYVTADMRLWDLANFLDDNKIHGAPVLSNGGAPVGVVSRTDLIRGLTEHEAEDPHRSWYRMLNNEGEYDTLRTDFEDSQLQGSDLTVADVMSSDVVAVGPDWSAGRIAAAMQENAVHRVLVVDRAKIVGIISVTDLLRATVAYEKRLEAE